MTEEFMKKFTKYLRGCQDVYDDYTYRNGFNTQRKGFTYTVGRKYAKVIGVGGVHSFVNMKDGSVFKPASWNAPAKHPRGNIYDDSNGLAGMTPHGPYYMK